MIKVDTIEKYFTIQLQSLHSQPHVNVQKGRFPFVCGDMKEPEQVV
ncbi:hypothetical protein [Metabacillus rhizolycopersici]|uniref:Uncharacterized protein n=1 Tax=Metabacillus rhizolycopersici TaxID=2875709 RepID=A0ABS7UPU5_9BACI|nr:hypothetical protein [Metabacillus rhizolycopersici]MBZ5750176.1 hypothetical protein [Metabacillus rhizolycopersici]